MAKPETLITESASIPSATKTFTSFVPKKASLKENVEICEAIKRRDNSKLKELLSQFSMIDLSNMQIDDQDIEFLSIPLTENTSIYKISLQNNKIKDAGATILAQTLSDNPNICEINLANNNISNSGAYVLKQMLEHNYSISEFYIFDNKTIGSKIYSVLNETWMRKKIRGKQLISAIQDEELEIIDKLRLYRHFRDYDGVTALVLAAESTNEKILEILTTKSATTTKPDRHDNKLIYDLIKKGDSDSLEKTLDQFSEISLVNFDEEKKLNDREIKTLAKALENNQSIKYVFLNCNITIDGADALKTALEKNQNIHVLSLDNSHFDVGAAEIIAQSLANNRGIRRISFDNCDIGDTKAKFFVETLCKNNRISLISLANNKITDATFDESKKLVETNHNITELDLSDNEIDTKQLEALCAFCSQRERLYNQLILAIKLCKWDKIAEFQKNGAAIDLTVFDLLNDKRDNPLHTAIRSGSLLMVGFILQFNINLDHKNKDGKTPLELARELGNEDICELISTKINSGEVVTVASDITCGSTSHTILSLKSTFGTKTAKGWLTAFFRLGFSKEILDEITLKQFLEAVDLKINENPQLVSDLAYFDDEKLCTIIFHKLHVIFDSSGKIKADQKLLTKNQLRNYLTALNSSLKLEVILKTLFTTALKNPTNLAELKNLLQILVEMSSNDLNKPNFILLLMDIFTEIKPEDAMQLIKLLQLDTIQCPRSIGLPANFDPYYEIVSIENAPIVAILFDCMILGNIFGIPPKISIQDNLAKTLQILGALDSQMLDVIFNNLYISEASRLVSQHSIPPALNTIFKAIFPHPTENQINNEIRVLFLSNLFNSATGKKFFMANFLTNDDYDKDGCCTIRGQLSISSLRTIQFVKNVYRFMVENKANKALCKEMLSAMLDIKQQSVSIKLLFTLISYDQKMPIPELQIDDKDMQKITELSTWNERDDAPNIREATALFDACKQLLDKDKEVVPTRLSAHL